MRNVDSLMRPNSHWHPGLQHKTRLTEIAESHSTTEYRHLWSGCEGFSLQSGHEDRQDAHNENKQT